jgi:hypothetical protein
LIDAACVHRAALLERDRSLYSWHRIHAEKPQALHRDRLGISGIFVLRAAARVQQEIWSNVSEKVDRALSSSAAGIPPRAGGSSISRLSLLHLLLYY